MTNTSRGVYAGVAGEPRAVAGGIGGMAQGEVGWRETLLEAGTLGTLKELADRRGIPKTGQAIAPIAAANIILRLSIAASFWTSPSAPLLAGSLRPLMAEEELLSAGRAAMTCCRSHSRSSWDALAGCVSKDPQKDG